MVYNIRDNEVNVPASTDELDVRTLEFSLGEAEASVSMVISDSFFNCNATFASYRRIDDVRDFGSGPSSSFDAGKPVETSLILIGVQLDVPLEEFLVFVRRGDKNMKIIYLHFEYCEELYGTIQVFVPSITIVKYMNQINS